MSRTIVAFYAPSGRVYSRVAWTGGDTPTPEIRRNADYRYLRRMLFREQVRECGGLDLWACAGTSALDRARIFWHHATLDAWRTFSSFETDGLRAARVPAPTLPDLCHHAEYRIYVNGQYVESAGNLGSNAQNVLDFWQRRRPGKSVEARATACTLPNCERPQR